MIFKEKCGRARETERKEIESKREDEEKKKKGIRQIERTIKGDCKKKRQRESKK